jgi:uncharacterized membrane protein YeaQ/YmgE (transglycosylase-associated protein family)
MGIIGWIVLGLLAGFIAKAIMPVAGALLGGFLATAFGLGDPIDEFFDLSTWIAAVAGALLMLFIWNAIHERRIA